MQVHIPLYVPGRPARAITSRALPCIQTPSVIMTQRRLIYLAGTFVTRQVSHHFSSVSMGDSDCHKQKTRDMPAMTPPLLLCSLLPDVLHAIVRLNCSDMHSTDADAAASAQDTATALRLTCRTLRAAVDTNVAQLDIRASSSADIEQAAALFPGLQHALGCSPLQLIKCGVIMAPCGDFHAHIYPSTRRSSKDTFVGSRRCKHDEGHASADAVPD
jgi:hypothetical protein